MSTDASDQQTFNNELRGALFKNDKGGNPARPDYRGNCEIGGQQYRISAWIKQARSGMTFMSLAFTAVVEQPPAAAAPATPGDFAPATPADDLPF
jgi:hypothetical protein